jgi:glycosyltransferase involved in cell wall biosynthesis
LATAPDHWYRNKLRYATFRGPLWQDEMRRLIHEIQPDVVHVQHALGFGLSALDLIAGLRLPMVITLPDYWLLCPGILGDCRGDLSRCARECCAERRLSKIFPAAVVASLRARRRHIHRLVTGARPLLVAISDATRNRFEAEGFPPDLLVTHEWGIDVAPIRELSAASQSRPQPVVPRIVFMGSIRSHKGCHVLLESFKRLQSHASLQFYGGGDEAYIQRLREQSHGLNVQFHGRFDHSEVGRILADSDVVAVPSVWDEAYCLVAQEAMAARKPIVASQVGGIADRVTHGVNGFLVPPNDPAALAEELDRVLSRLPDLVATLDFDSCLLDIRDDARGWMELYRRAVAEQTTRRRPSLFARGRI